VELLSRGSWVAVLVLMAVAIASNLVRAGMWLVDRQRRPLAGAGVGGSC
jgi:hypothetical protein